MMKLANRNGFTLLELLVVVIIIGILAALAIPTFINAAEKSKGAEAMINLGSLRAAVIRYKIEYDVLPGSFDDLDIENPGDPLKFPTRLWNYAMTGDFTITATRISGKYTGRTITVDQGGTWGGDWPWKPRQEPSGQ